MNHAVAFELRSNIYVGAKLHCRMLYGREWYWLSFKTFLKNISIHKTHITHTHIYPGCVWMCSKSFIFFVFTIFSSVSSLHTNRNDEAAKGTGVLMYCEWKNHTQNFNRNNRVYCSFSAIIMMFFFFWHYGQAYKV